MRIIDDKDTTDFTTPDGTATLTLLQAVRHGDAERIGLLQKDEVISNLRAIGMDLKMAMEQMAQLSVGEREQAEKQAAQEPPSASVRLAKLKAVAVKLVVGGTEYGGMPNVVKAYQKMDGEFAAWVDAQVEQVWAASVPSDDEKKSQAAVLEATDEQGAAAN